jgi:hypothetical protein
MKKVFTLLLFAIGTLFVATSNAQMTSDTITRPFNTIWQMSNNYITRMDYNCSVSVTSTLLGTNSGYIYLESSGDYTTWTSLCKFGLSISGIASTISLSGELTGVAKNGYYVRLRTGQSGVNTPTFTYLSGQELWE